MLFPFVIHGVSRVEGLRGVSVSEYVGEASCVLRAFKGFGSRQLCGFLAESMAAALAQFLRDSGPAPKRSVWLIPAPSSRQSFKARGFVPAKLLASAIRRKLIAANHPKVSVVDCLRINGPTQDQAGLGREERAENLRGKFVASEALISRLAGNANGGGGEPLVILIDDIVTTGATLREMRRSLSAVGVQAAFFATFAETL
jgi:predicted amidophosphoribosyltransferase